MFTLCSLYIVYFNMLMHNTHVQSVHNKLLYSKQTKGTQFACLFCYIQGRNKYDIYKICNVTVQLIRNIKCDTCSIAQIMQMEDPVNIKSKIGLYISIHRCVPCCCLYTSTWIVYHHGCDVIAQNIVYAAPVYFCCFLLIFP